MAPHATAEPSICLGTGSGEQSIYSLIQQNVQARPTSTAASQGERSLTYEKLNLASLSLASLFDAHGVRAGDTIPIFLSRCLESVASILALMQLGVCFVPMDAESWSQARVDAVLQAIEPKLVIISRHTDLNAGSTSIIGAQDVDSTYNALAEGVDVESVTERLDKCRGPEEPVYIIFTSGTTGTPKGVLIPRRCVENYVLQGGDKGMPFNLGVSSKDSVLLLFSLAFDAAWGVFFSTLCHGGHLVLSEPGQVLEDAKKCTILPATPSLLSTLGDPDSYSQVQNIFLGGESPSPALVQKWWTPERRIFNCYGPTETTICASMAELRPGCPIVLGNPMTDTMLLVLNDQMEGSAEGEIYISGPGLASGYYKNAQLTAERFITWNGIRVYRTLDRARRTPEGLVFCGREDTMVKNRGFLINIEMDVLPILQSYQRVHSAAAFMDQGSLRDATEIIPINIEMDVLPILQSYQRVHSAAAFMDQGSLVGAISPDSIDTREMRRKLFQSHDRFVVPDQITAYAELCRTSNGKIDLAKLQESFGTRQNDASSDPVRGSQAGILQEAVAETLEHPVDSVAMHCSFWELGGNSLLAIRLSSLLNRKGYIIRFQEMFAPVSLTLLSERLEPAGVLEREHSAASMDTTIDETLVTPLITATQMGMIRSSIKEPTTSYMLNIVNEFEGLGKHQKNSNLFQPLNTFRLIISEAGGAATLLWLVHHSLIDGWSMGVIVKQVQGLLRGEVFAGEPSQFWQFSQRLPQHLRQVRDEGMVFWKEAMSKVSDAVPLTLPRPADQSGGRGFGATTASIDLSISRIEQICRDQKVTSAAMLHAAWTILLRFYTAQEQVTFGTIFSGRNFPMSGMDNTVGPILNTCPFPMSLAGLNTKANFLARVQDLLLRVSSHQWSAPEALENIMPGSHSRIFQTTLFLEYDLPGFDDSEWQFSRTDVPEFGLTVIIRREGDHLSFRGFYDQTMYTRPVMQRMMIHFRNLFLALLDSRCDTMPKLRERMLETCEFLSLTTNSSTFMSPYVGPSNLKDRFETGVDQWPDEVAIESPSHSITYRELDHIGNHVASAIAERVRPGEAVGIVSDRTMNWLISVIAVIKAGSVYVPLDTKLPTERMQIMIQSAQVKLCIFPNKDCHDQFSDLFHNKILLHEMLEGPEQRKWPRLETITGPEDIAYITFTSGSTGVPKGVRIEHQSVVSYLSYGPARMDARPGRRHSQMFSPGFDVSQAEIFGNLCYGATLVLADPTDPFAHLSRVDATMITPSFLSVIDPSDYPNLDTILFAGEAVPQDLADRWTGTRTVYNSYGPCECTIGCLFQPLQPFKEVTLGRTIPRVAVYLLDSQNHPVPIRVPGEICLSGIQIADGYIGSDMKAVSQSRFVPDPFMSGYRMYRTGDCAVWTEDMEPRFLGRFDNQVKVRGYRVELTEIENAIRMVSPEVRRAAVIVSNSNIVAFVEPEDVDIPTIQAALRAKLPGYACPSAIMALSTLPTMPNQKLDRKALQSHSCLASKKGQTSLTLLQRLVSEVWREAVHLSEDIEISEESDFLALGGNSISQIKTAQMASRRLNTKLPLGLFIWNTTLSTLCDEIAAHLPKENQLADSASFESSWMNIKSNNNTVSHLEEEFVQLSLASPSPQAFNVACHLRLRGEVNLEALEKAMVTVISHEPVLQSCFSVIDGRVTRRQSSLPCEILRDAQSEVAISSFASRPFDLSTGPLTRILIDEGLSWVDVVLVQHHAITDKAAMKLFFIKIQDEYDRILRNGPELQQSLVSSRSPHYALVTFSIPPSPPFQASGPSADGYIGYSRSVSLKKQQNLPGSMELYVALVGMAIANVQGTRDIVIGIPHLDRTEPGTEDLLCCFLDRLPVRVKTPLDNSSGIMDLISSVRVLIQNALTHSIPLRDIRKITGQDEPFQVMVVYNRREDSIANGITWPGINVEDGEVRTRGAKFPLLVEFTERENKTTCEFEYMETLTSSETIDAIGQAMGEILAVV
ncbi:hypothetical protein N7486_004410 [Penicillium sp. IBT 16267x]|nr:hypothetical protein N7486_004410 [Penicillium sp. IBT 16267x]